MLRSARIQNFRCLADVELTFEPLTILVGPNASGKSAVLSALDPGTPLGIPTDRWRGDPGQEPRIVFRFSDGAKLKTARPLQYQLLHLQADDLRTANQVAEATALETNGANLVNAFATLTRDQQGELVRTFIDLVPMYRDVVARPSTKGHHRLLFQDRWGSNVWYEPRQVSDGTLIVLALLLIQYQARPIEVVAIEEPERGLHPYLIRELVDNLRRLALGKLGPKPIQVILATHSADLLEFAEPKEVRFLSRRESDGTTQVEVAPTDTADWAKAVKEYEGSLGNLWLSGALGGVPGG